MQIYINPTQKEWNKLTQRPAINTMDLMGLVQQVFNEVQEHGDVALRQYTKKFDGAELNQMIVSNCEIEIAVNQVSPDLKAAIQLAKKNIYTFHIAQKTEKQVVETINGVQCWQESRPIEKVGLYIPGGTAPLFSTILMLGVPAMIAGCPEIILCSPPDTKGNIAPEILYTASLLGINKIYKIGGVQAIAAMSIGTETIPSVYKIFGPGNQYVTAAKQYAFTRGTAIDMPAGPSELLVMADESSNPSYVAADLLSQAEHGVDSQVICVVNDKELIQPILEEIRNQLVGLPRKNIAEKAMNQSKIICFDSDENCINFINYYAPEHFILAVKNEDYYINNLVNAGSVFIGNYTPESAGDYASGTNHTLPTNGYARMYSGINLDAFCKKITFQKISKEGIQNIGTAIELMATAEGLQAHANAVTIRLEKLKNNEA